VRVTMPPHSTRRPCCSICTTVTPIQMTDIAPAGRFANTPRLSPSSMKGDLL
jgi:hypothetical protein